jgi:hypothetical protein
LFDLVAKLQRIHELQPFLSPSLSGRSFAIKQGLCDEAKKDYEDIDKTLVAAFSTSPLWTFNEFTFRRLIVGESVDVFLVDLKRLAMLISQNDNGDWIKCAFLAGLLEEVRKQINASCALVHMRIAEVVEKAWSLVSVQDSYLMGHMVSWQSR